MSWNLPAQWLLLHPMCAEQSCCLWQGYYPRRIMVIDTMSCCLPATCSAFFLTDSCMLEIQLFWVNSSCQETKHQHSNFAKAFSCFCVLSLLFCFSLKKPAGIRSRWFEIWQDNINCTGLLLLLLAAHLSERKGGDEQPGAMQGKVLDNEQDSKDAGESLTEGLMCKGKVLSGRGPALKQWPCACLRVSWENSGRAGKKGWWIGNCGRREPDPDVRAALVTSVIANTCPGPDSSHSEGCGWIRWVMKESRRSNKKIRNMILQPIYLWKDQSHHNPLRWPSSCPRCHFYPALCKEFGTFIIQKFLFISSEAIKIPSSMFSK